MNICIVRKKYNPFGGAERYLDLLADYLARQGHDVHVFANKWPTGGNTGVVFHRVPMIGGLSLLKNWSFALSAWWLLRRFKGDVVLSNERLFKQDIFRASDGVHRTWLRIRRRNAPVLKKLSFAVNPLHWSVRFFDWYIFNRRAFRGIIAPSGFIKHDILSNYDRVREEDIRVIYNGVDIERYCPENRDIHRETVRREIGLTLDGKMLLFVGTGFERKGLRYAVESLRYLPDNVSLVVAGKGRLRPYASLAEQWGVSDRIRFLGPVDGMHRYYAAADVALLPTLYEPMANVILEALATGIPVVTSRDCGNSEVITDGRDGAIVSDPTDAREIARKVEAVLNISAEETGRSPREKAEQFTLERTVKEIMDEIERVGTGNA